MIGAKLPWATVFFLIVKSKEKFSWKGRIVHNLFELVPSFKIKGKGEEGKREK